MSQNYYHVNNLYQGSPIPGLWHICNWAPYAWASCASWTGLAQVELHACQPTAHASWAACPPVRCSHSPTSPLLTQPSPPPLLGRQAAKVGDHWSTIDMSRHFIRRVSQVHLRLGNTCIRCVFFHKSHFCHRIPLTLLRENWTALSQ